MAEVGDGEGEGEGEEDPHATLYDQSHVFMAWFHLVPVAHVPRLPMPPLPQL